MIEYKLYPYTFGPGGGTIEAVIRNFNHMNMHPEVMVILMKEFNLINQDALPPKMGQQVMIPVLLPFCDKHDTGQQKFTTPKPIETSFAGPLNT